MDKIKVLVIDDKKVIGDLFEITLGYSGHIIRFANNAAEALEAVKQESFDIVFLDIIMPGKDGIAILEMIKCLNPDLPVVMMSGYSIQEKRNRALELGAVDCLKKPFEFDEVRRVVREAIGKEI